MRPDLPNRLSCCLNKIILKKILSVLTSKTFASETHGCCSIQIHMKRMVILKMFDVSHCTHSGHLSTDNVLKNESHQRDVSSVRWDANFWMPSFRIAAKNSNGGVVTTTRRRLQLQRMPKRTEAIVFFLKEGFKTDVCQISAFEQLGTSTYFESRNI